MFGQWWWAAWIMLMCNMVLPLSLFSQKLRRNPSWLFILSLFINLGMWFERFVIIVPCAVARVRAVAVERLRADDGSTFDPASASSAGSSCGSCCSSGSCR